MKERDMRFTEEQNQQNRVTAGYFQRGKKSYGSYHEKSCPSLCTCCLGSLHWAHANK